MKLVRFALVAGLLTLAACSESPREEAAENVEENSEVQAETLEEVAENAPTPAAEQALENDAEALRELGEESANAVRNGAGAVTNNAQ